MRWLIAIGIATLLASAAYAHHGGGNVGIPYPPNGVEAVVYTYDDAGNIIPATECRAFKELPEGGDCNQKEWSFNFTVDASVAQWIDWNITHTDIDFYIRKPGVYLVDSVILTIKSNGAIEFKAESWTDLWRGTEDSIELEIALTQCGIDPNTITGWIPASSLVDKTVVLQIPDSDALHDPGIQRALWFRLTVEACDSTCEYLGGGKFYVQMETQKPWLDDEGNWGSLFPIP